MTVLRVGAGTDFVFAWPVFGPDGTTPLNVAGWSAAGGVRSVDDYSPLLTWDSSDVALSTGLATLTLGHADTAAWSTWALLRGVWAVRLTDPSGKVSPLDSGLLIVVPAV